MALKREFLTTSEVAELLGISPFTIRRYIQLRKLKAVKLEGSYRVRRADLQKFLKAREIETEEELAAEEEAESPEKSKAPRGAAPLTKPARPPRPIDRKTRRTPPGAPARAGRSRPPRRAPTGDRKEP